MCCVTLLALAKWSLSLSESKPSALEGGWGACSPSSFWAL